MLSLHPHVHLPGDPSLPVLLMLHGTGGDERSLLPLAGKLRPGAAVLSPRGNVDEHGAARFFRRLREGVFDLPDLRRRTGELGDWLTAALDQYALRGRPVVAVGYSNGANVAGSLLLMRPGLLSAAALLRPMVPFVPETPPDLAGTRVLLTFGARDPITPPAHARDLPALLSNAGAAVETHILDAGHELTHDDLALASAFVAG